MKQVDYDVMHSKIKKALNVEPSFRYAQMAMECLDLTSLNPDDSEQSIRHLCQKAKRIEGHYPAAVCVFPQFVNTAAQALNGTSIKIATVINFPFGSKTNDGTIATVENTTSAVNQAIENGATEIDIVADYFNWKENMDESQARALLVACRSACCDNVTMKVILETAAFEFEDEIEAISQMALECGADFIKTSTGKFKDPEFTDNNGGATLNAAYAMIRAISKFKSEKHCGIKISGGLDANNYTSFLALIDQELGPDYLKPDTFRLGASRLYDDLQLTIESKGQIKGRRTCAPAHSY